MLVVVKPRYDKDTENQAAQKQYINTKGCIGMKSKMVITIAVTFL